MKEENGKQMSRRGFLKMGATASVAMGLSMAMPPAVADTLGISTKQGLAGRGGESIPFATRVLGSGRAAMEVSAIGLGCMGMSHHRSAHPDKKTLVRLLHQAVDMGVICWLHRSICSIITFRPIVPVKRDCPPYSFVPTPCTCLPTI